MHLAEERQHVVLAHAEELDVLHHHHLVVLHFVQRAVDDLAGCPCGSRWSGTSAPYPPAAACAPALRAPGSSPSFASISRTSGARSGSSGLRLHHFHHCFIRFHLPSLQRCSAPSRRCGSSPVWATRRETPRSNSASTGGRSPPPGSPKSAPRAANDSTSTFRFRCSNGASTSRRTSSSSRVGVHGPARASSSGPRSAHLHHVVVAVAVRIVALPVQLPILFFAQLRARAGGARPRTRSGGSRGTRLLSEIIHVQVRRLVHPHGVQAAARRRSGAAPAAARCRARCSPWSAPPVEGRHLVVQKPMVVRHHYLAVQDFLQLLQIQHHAGHRVGLALAGSPPPHSCGRARAGWPPGRTVCWFSSSERLGMAAHMGGREFYFAGNDHLALFLRRSAALRRYNLIIVSVMQSVKIDRLLRAGIVAPVASSSFT